MATAHRASGTPTLQRSARAGRKRDGISWHSPLTLVVKGDIVPDLRAAGFTRRLEVHIWTRPRCQGALEWKTRFGTDAALYPASLVKTCHGLRALMKSALPLLITTAASGALYLVRV